MFTQQELISKYYWTQDIIDNLEQAQSYREMFELVAPVLERAPEGLVQVCGPFSTGGLGSIEKNMQRMGDTVRVLNELGYPLFNQVPLEVPMQKIKEKREEMLGGAYDTDILDHFYLPLFESGAIKKLFFMHGWESSHGSKWEHDQGERLGLEIVYLPEDFLESRSL